MANKKQPYSWGLVKPGDIVSFRYKSIHTGESRFNTILVLNPKLNVILKSGKRTRHLIGIKIEENNKTTKGLGLRINSRQMMLLEKIGTFKQVDEENNLYRLDIDSSWILNDIKGIKPLAYEKIARSLEIQGQYRTYDWKRTRASAVYLEPIKLFTNKYQGEDKASVEKISPTEKEETKIKVRKKKQKTKK